MTDNGGIFKPQSPLRDPRAKRLAAAVDASLLLIDAPGVSRGVAGAELLTGLIASASVDTCCCSSRRENPHP